MNWLKFQFFSQIISAFRIQKCNCDKSVKSSLNLDQWNKRRVSIFLTYSNFVETPCCTLALVRMKNSSSKFYFKPDSGYREVFGQNWGGWRAGSGRKKERLRSPTTSFTLPNPARRWSRSSPARFFRRPHWLRAWNRLQNCKYIYPSFVISNTQIANRLTKGFDICYLAFLKYSANQRTSCRSYNWSMTTSTPLSQTCPLIRQAIGKANTETVKRS